MKSPAKFYLVQRREEAPHVLHAFDTAEQRDAMTKELIYGTGDLCPQERRGLDLYLEELRDTGSVEFEGDPGLEWFTAIPA